MALDKKKGPALEADLLAAGHRLRDVGSDEFTWRDLLVFVQNSNIEGELFRLEHPEAAGWTKTNMLLADIADSLNWLVWAKTKDGSKNRNMPKKIPRPGVEDDNVKRVKGQPLPLDEFKQKLNELRARMKSSTTEETVTHVSVRRMKKKGKA